MVKNLDVSKINSPFIGMRKDIIVSPPMPLNLNVQSILADMLHFGYFKYCPYLPKCVYVDDSIVFLKII